MAEIWPGVLLSRKGGSMINPEPWVARTHPGPRATPYPLTAGRCEAVETAIRPAATEFALWFNAQNAPPFQ